jgi:hypothetical protein
MKTLQLQVVEVADVDHWRWQLQDADGGFLANQKVALNRRDPEYLGFVDLAGFLRRNADPGRRLASEAELVDRVGGWIGQQVFGEGAKPGTAKPVGRALVAASPTVVRVQLPLEADFLLHRPLELAVVAAREGEPGRPLARQDVSLVFEVQGDVEGAAKQPVGERLRMLAVFSLPSGGTALALRRERYELARLVRRVATRSRRAVELHVLQYGVTRERLAEALGDGKGWDVVHFSGHGLADGLELEQADGTPDLVRTPDLIGLLWPARERLKLVTLSSCQSAAATAADTRRWLQLAVPKALEDEATAEAVQAPLPGLARELVRRLDCAVLAMRYPVVDDFAIAMDQQLYAGLFGQDQSLARAVQLAVPAAAGVQPTSGAPALSIATPALFGPLAADLSLRPPSGTPSFNVGTAKMAYFDPEPPRFVGRAGVMARASAALAPQSPYRGVLLVGMAGAGKTAAALELAYRHEPVFGALVWWQAPPAGQDISTSLRDLAVALEAQLEGFAMVQAVGSVAELVRFLPRLTQLLEDQAILLVLDNLESLLTPAGRWQDPRWGQLVDALVAHDGESRLVLTSRVRPADLAEGVLAEPIHALSLDEALLLARELPQLGRLLRGDEVVPPSRGGEVQSGWTLVRRTLEVVQGHPKLLELADAQATDPARLAARLTQAEQATDGTSDQLGIFFQEGETALGEDHFVRQLTGWTQHTTQTLPEAPRLLFGVLCCLEDSDRVQTVVEAAWPVIWEKLGRPGDPPALDAALGALAAHGLVQLDTQGDAARYRLHPGVADAGREQAGGRLRQAVDTTLASLWGTVLDQARGAEGGEAGGPLLRAARSAAPYLLRLEEWEAASQLLEHVLLRDQAPGTVQAVLPLLRRIAEATRGTDRELIDAFVVARAVRMVDLAAAEVLLGGLLDQAIDQQRFDIASMIGTELSTLLRRAGRLGEALAVVEQLPELTRRAGLGPWTQLTDRIQRAQLLASLGRNEEALAEVEVLRGELTGLPETTGQDERVEPWMVREVLFDVGRSAALNLERWEAALHFNAEQIASLRARGAPDREVAYSAANDYGPLLNLDRLTEAERLLLACREVFEAAGDLRSLGKTLNALASLEAKRGHTGDAIRFTQAALRYNYVVQEPDEVAINHHNLANRLREASRDPAEVLAHRLAAGLLRYQMGSGGLAITLAAVASDLATSSEPAVPDSFAELCARVEQVDGIRFAELMARLPGPAANGDAALAEVIALARAQPDPAAANLEHHLAQWTPIIEQVVAAASGDTQATQMLSPILEALAGGSDWGPLVEALRRVLAGERDQQSLLDGLDPIDTVILTQALQQLADQSARGPTPAG